MYIIVKHSNVPISIPFLLWYGNEWKIGYGRIRITITVQALDATEFVFSKPCIDIQLIIRSNVSLLNPNNWKKNNVVINAVKL